MCGGMPWAMPIEFGKKQGPNCKRINKKFKVLAMQAWACAWAWAHYVATSFSTRNPNICKVVVGSCYNTNGKWSGSRP